MKLSSGREVARPGAGSEQASLGRRGLLRGVPPAGPMAARLPGRPMAARRRPGLSNGGALSGLPVAPPSIIHVKCKSLPPAIFEGPFFLTDILRKN